MQSLRNYAKITAHGINYVEKNIGLDIFQRYKSIRDILITGIPDLFGDLPEINESILRDGSTPLDKERIFGYRLREIVREMDYCLSLLSSARLVDLDQTVNVTNEGVFFQGQYYDAMQNVHKIILSAKMSIAIIDAYVDQKVLDLLTSKKKEIRIQILTRNVNKAFKSLADSFNKQYGNLSIHESNAFHDRFIIVDESEYYHFGASIKDLGNRGFMFSRITEPDVVRALQNKWKQEWTAATKAV